MRGRSRAVAATVTAGVGSLVFGLAPSPWPQLLGVPLLAAALFWGLVPLPGPVLRWRAVAARRQALSWGLPLALLLGAVCLAYLPLLGGEMPWAAGQADHPTHQYQAWLFVERLVPSGRLTGWSDLRWAGYPALELYPMGGPLWVALWRFLTLGLLDWEATYALAILAMVGANVVAVYVATRRLAGPWAALAAALLLLFERGWPRQGGDHYAIDVGVWPVTMGIGPLLLCVERQWAWIARRAGAGALVGASLLAGWALLCHPFYLPVLVLAAPCIVVLALVRGVGSDRAVLGTAATVVLGLALAGFWYGPFLANGAYSEPGGAPFRSLGNMGEGIAMASFLPSFWPPAFVAAVLGGAVALLRGGGMALAALLAIALVLAASSTPLEISSSLAALAGSVQQERFLIPLRALLCILAGYGAVTVLAAASSRARTWTTRTKLAGAGAVFLTALLAAPAVEGIVKHLVVPIVELDHGAELAHRRDLLAMCSWLREQVGDDEPPPRTAWYVGYGHHEYNNAPVHCGLAQIVETPAETFVTRPGGISEREVRSYGVRWVVGDRPIEGRESYLTLARRFGALHVYEVAGADPLARVTVLGPGRASVERFEDELIRVRIDGAGEGSRAAVHVANFPTWRATMNGEPVPISSGHLGLPRGDFIHVPVSDGVLELRYVRGAPYLLGALATFLAALILALVGLASRSTRLAEAVRRWKPLRWGLGLGRPARTTAICALALVALAPVLLASRGDDGPRGRILRDRCGARGESLGDLLHRADAWVVEDGETRPLRRRWDGRLGGHLPPEVIVDRHVEALDLGDPRRVLAARAGPGQEIHVRIPVDAARGVRGCFARGGRGSTETSVEVRLGGESLGTFTADRLGEWHDLEALGRERRAGPLELVVTVSEPGRAVLLDVELAR